MPAQQEIRTAQFEGATAKKVGFAARKPIRVMSMLPQAKSPERMTGSSLLDEELASLSQRGVQLHTVWRKIPAGWASQTLHAHLLPRLRNPAHLLKSLGRMTRHCGSLAAATPKLRQRLELMRYQQGIADVIEAEQIDLIHSHWVRPGGTGGVLAQQVTGRPLVITLRGADVLTEASIDYGDTLDPWASKRISYALSCADRVMCVSQRIQERAVELGADPDKTSVVPKGVHHEHFVPGSRADARRALGLEDRPTILFVGAFGPWKGLDDLLEAFRIVRQHVKNVQLVLCGKGLLEPQVRAFIQRYDLGSAIHLPGYIERAALPRYFQACDVFVLSSLTEGSGNVLLEAASCGRPSVGTRVGGIPDYIVDSETGLLAEKRNPSDLADKLQCVLNDEVLADQMGSAGRQRVESSFRYEQMIDRILQVYDEVL